MAKRRAAVLVIAFLAMPYALTPVLVRWFLPIADDAQLYLKPVRLKVTRPVLGEPLVEVQAYDFRALLPCPLPPPGRSIGGRTVTVIPCGSNRAVYLWDSAGSVRRPWAGEGESAAPIRLVLGPEKSTVDRLERWYAIGPDDVPLFASTREYLAYLLLLDLRLYPKYSAVYRMDGVVAALQVGDPSRDSKVLLLVPGASGSVHEVWFASCENHRFAQYEINLVATSIQTIDARHGT